MSQYEDDSEPTICPECEKPLDECHCYERHDDESLTPEERNGGVEGLMNEINRLEGR